MRQAEAEEADEAEAEEEDKFALEIGENAPPLLTPQRKTPAPCTATASVDPPIGSREIPAIPLTLRFGLFGLESAAASE